MSVTGTWETEQKGGKSDIGASLGNVPMSKRKKGIENKKKEEKEGGEGRTGKRGRGKRRKEKDRDGGKLEKRGGKDGNFFR